MNKTLRVPLPLYVRILRAIGCLRVQVAGIDHATDEWIYTTQARWWHPLVLAFLLFLLFCRIVDAFRMPVVERRVSNG